MSVPRREISVALAIALLALLLALTHPSYFSAENLSDLFLSNLPVLIVAVGMTFVILSREIDISVGSQFAICGVAAGEFAKLGLPPLVAALGACIVGGVMGAGNGFLIAFLRIPSIIVTLASMIALRDLLRWATEGAWIENLPASFQWFGLPQRVYPDVILGVASVLTIMAGWCLRNLKAGRAIVATGSDEEVARLMGIDTAAVKALVFCATGVMTGLAAALNAVRFNQIPTNAGLGLEMKVIAAVIVGGASIQGGSGRIAGTVLGVILLAMIGPALTFLGISAWWEKALQGAIILFAVVTDSVTLGAWKRRILAGAGSGST